MVSIIIPTFNRYSLLSETLDSILTQTYKNWECLVVDDGSSDYTPELLEFYQEKDSRIKYFIRPDNLPKGANACRNFGFEKSKGDYVIWFDDDDIMLKSYLDLIIKKFQPEFDLIISNGFYVDQKLQCIGKTTIKLKDDLFKGLVLWENEILINSVCFKKKFLENFILFALDIERGQEAELFTRLFYKINHAKVGFIEEPRFLYRQHSHSKTAEDKFYIPSFKTSRAKIALRNLNYSIELGDKELINYLYLELKKLFFTSLKERHFSLTKLIWKRIIIEVWKVNKSLSIHWFRFGCILLILGRDSTRFGYGLRNSKIL